MFIDKNKSARAYSEERFLPGKNVVRVVVNGVLVSTVYGSRYSLGQDWFIIFIYVAKQTYICPQKQLATISLSNPLNDQ